VERRIEKVCALVGMPKQLNLQTQTSAEEFDTQEYRAFWRRLGTKSSLLPKSDRPTQEYTHSGLNTYRSNASALRSAEGSHWVKQINLSIELVEGYLLWSGARRKVKAEGSSQSNV